MRRFLLLAGLLTSIAIGPPAWADAVISALGAAGAISGTDIFPDCQSCTTSTPMLGATVTQLTTYMNANVAIGASQVTSGTLAAARMLPLATNDVYQGNGSNVPAAVSLSAAIDAAIGNTQGGILYRSASNWAYLGPGTSGQFLETQGASANPIWGSPSGSGTVNSCSTADAVAYYATTGTAVSCLAGVGTAGQVLTSNGTGSAPTFQAAAGGTPILFAGTATNSSNAYAVSSTTPSGFTLTNLYGARFTAPATNTGASTLNVDTTGATASDKQVSSGLAALNGGEIVSGVTYDAIYNSTCTCFVLINSPQGAVINPATSATVTAAQWAGWAFFTVASSGQTITLPVSSTLSTNGGIAISAVGNPVTLTPNSADAINAGTTGASVTIGPGVTAFVTTTGSGAINAAPLNVGASTPFALTDAATIAVDASKANNFTVTLGGNRTLGNPTNLLAGQVLNFWITQPASGGPFTLAYGTDYQAPGGSSTMVLSTTANAKDLVTCVSDTNATMTCNIINGIVH